MTDAQAAALVAAGRLMQSRHWPGGIQIETRPGESYPAAVARVVATLDTANRDHLRELVAWVREYELADGR